MASSDDALATPGTAALTGVLPGPDGHLPLLILDQRPEMAVRSGPAEHVNLFVPALLSMGLTMVTTISEQLALAMDGQAAALARAQAASPEPWVLATGWRLELSAHRATRLNAPDGSIVYGGECGQPRPWRALVTSTSRCAVLIGAIGLWPGPGECPFTRITTLLDHAAHAGELIGGLVDAR